MDQKVNPKRAYRSPQITKIILRREQAILSACSTTTPVMEYLGSRGCDVGCRRSNMTGSSAAPPS